MHWQAYQYVTTVRALLPELFLGTNVLEIGSHNVNGGVRELFQAENYVGVDLSEGEGVDVVISGHEYCSSKEFDISISCECFEHNPHYQETLDNMIEHIVESGIVIFSCATTGRPEHGTSATDPSLSPGTSSLGWDYYKNLTEVDFKKLDTKLFGWFFYTNKHSNDIYFIGAKSEEGYKKINSIHTRLKKYLSMFETISSCTFDNVEKYLPHLQEIDLAPSLLFFLKHQSQNSEIIQNKNFYKLISSAYFLWPNSWEVNHLVSKCYESDGYRAKALYFAKKANELSLGKDFCINEFATLLASSNQYFSAIQQLLQLPCVEGNDAILFKISSYYMKAGEYTQAFSYIEKAIKIKPENAIYIRNKVDALLHLNKNKEALIYAKKIISLSECPSWVYNYSSNVINRLT